jgi:hypothetical protein
LNVREARLPGLGMPAFSRRPASDPGVDRC